VTPKIKPIAVYRGQAAAMLGVSPNQIDRLRRRGVLRAVQLEPGALLQYPVADLEALFVGDDHDDGPVDLETVAPRAELEPVAPRRARRSPSPRKTGGRPQQP
jgi:hypothetical protein